MHSAETKSKPSNVLQRKSDTPFFQTEESREAFFGSETQNETSFFQSAPPSIQAKCDACEQEEKVQRKEEPEEQVAPEIQPKLTIGAPDDPYEKQADAVADQVVQRLAQTPSAVGTTSNAVQPKTAEPQEEQIQEKSEDGEQEGERLQMKPIFESTPPPDDAAIQRACASCEEEQNSTVQRKESGGETTASPNLSSRLASSQGSGSPLPADTKTQMEGAMGADFSGVRVHTGSDAADMSQGIHAQAFTHGSDIYFNEGKYDPGSTDGQRLLAHELVHTVQQGEGKKQNIQRNPKKKSNSGQVSIPIKLPVEPKMIDWSREDFTIYYLMKEYGFDKVQAIADYNNSLPSRFRGEWRVGEKDIIRGFIIVNKIMPVGYFVEQTQVLKEPRLPNGKRENYEKRKAEFDNLPKNVQKRINTETDKRYRERTKTKPGQEVNKDLWLEIRDEVIADDRFRINDEPAMEPKMLRDLHSHFKTLKKEFPQDKVFSELQAQFYDFLQYRAYKPEDIFNLPPASAPATSQNNRLRQNYLERWYNFLVKLRQIDTSTNNKGGSIDGHPRGEVGGSPDGVVKFEPKAKLLVIPVVNKYVKGGEVNFKVEFEDTPPESMFMNYFPHRARFNWTVYKGAKEYDSGPMLEALGGDNTYNLKLKENGTYYTTVEIKSTYFKNDQVLNLQSQNLEVVEESVREKEIFEQQFVSNDDSKAFKRKEDGTLSVNPHQKALGLEEEISYIDLKIGALRELSNQGKLPLVEATRLIEFMESQKTSLETIKTKLGKKSPYFVRASFLSRETSASMEVNAYMYENGCSVYDSHNLFSIILYDTTLDPSTPAQHSGVGIGFYDIKTPENIQKATAAAEKTAVEDMLSHWHLHNDYPDGTVRIGIQLHYSDQVYEKAIDTYNTNKTIRKGLAITAGVAGTIALIASPFTGGATAGVGVVLLKAAFVTAAITGTAALLMEVNERYEKEGELKIDGRLALDVLQLVTTVLGAFGTFSNALRVAGTVGKSMYLATLLGLDVGQAILIGSSVTDSIRKTENQYDVLIATETDPAKKASLQKEKQSAITQIIGAAIVNGSFLLVSVASGVHQIVRGTISGKKYSVSEEYVIMFNKKDREAIRAALGEHQAGKRILTDDEKFYLEEGLASISPIAKKGKVESETSVNTEKEVKSHPGDESTSGGKSTEVGDIVKPDPDLTRKSKVELEELAAKGNHKAVEELILRRQQGFVEPKPAELELKKMTYEELNNLAVENKWAAEELYNRELRMDANLKGYRNKQRTALIEGTNEQVGDIRFEGSERKGGLVGVAESDIPEFQGKLYEAASPRAGGKRIENSRIIKGEKESNFSPDSNDPRAYGHVEERLMTKFHEDVQESIKSGKLSAADLEGKTLKMNIEQESCNSCKSGIVDPLDSPVNKGSIAKFFKEYPNMRLEISESDPYSNKVKIRTYKFDKATQTIIRN